MSAAACGLAGLAPYPAILLPSLARERSRLPQPALPLFPPPPISSPPISVQVLQSSREALFFDETSRFNLSPIERAWHLALPDRPYTRVHLSIGSLRRECHRRPDR